MPVYWCDGERFFDYYNEDPKTTSKLYQEIVKLDRKPLEYFLKQGMLTIDQGTTDI